MTTTDRSKIVAPHAVLGTRDDPEYASGCLPDLDVVDGLVPRWDPAGWHVRGKLDRACQGVWIPRVVGGHGVGSNGTVRTVQRVYGGLECPLSVDQPRLRYSRSTGCES